MAYSAKILLDSTNAVTGDRLTTFEITYPRFVHAELMTHRLFSRNSASSRAIPIEKMIERVVEDPAGPVFWGKNQKGMQASEELSDVPQQPHLNSEMATAKILWLDARDVAVEHAIALNDIGVHKQIVNRLLEPWMWITVIVSATEYENFFALRCHKDAQPEIQKIAFMMRGLYQVSVPTRLDVGGWHSPLVFPEDAEVPRSVQLSLSAARCARVSYLTHEGKRDIEADVQLFDRLVTGGHWSPLEHVAQALPSAQRVGNFVGWRQLRKSYQNEHSGRRIESP